MRTLLLASLAVAVFGGGLFFESVRGADRPGIAALATRAGKPVIARVWHGKTPRGRADEYEAYLSAAVTKFPSIPGNLGYQVMRIDGGPEGDAYSEFQVTSYWESIEAIHAYAGEDVAKTHNLPRDPEFLVDLEPYVRNYELRVEAIRP